MSILSVDTISPIGSGTTLTLNATETKVNNFITVGTGASVSSPSSNVLTFGTNSNEKLRILSDGKVGIGEDNPQTILHINDNVPMIRLTDANASGTPDCELGGAGGNIDISADINGEKSDSVIRFNVDGSEKVRIDSSGFVGIENTSPNLSLAGARNLVIGSGSGDRGLTIMSGTSGVGHIEFSDGTGSSAEKTAGGIRYYHNSNYMRFNTNGGTERLRIDANGKVIIGTEFVNAGNAPAQISFYLSGVRGSYGGLGTNAVIFDNQTAAVDAGGTLQLAGYSGTAAVVKAAIRGGNEGSAATYAGYFSVFTRPASGVLTEKLRITSDGKIGINDTAPERTVDVKGSNCMVQLEGTGGSGKQWSLCSADNTTGAAVGSAGMFAIYNDTDGVAALRVSNSNYVLRPKLPYFYCTSTPTVGSPNIHSFGNVHGNNGNHYNNSNGRFTAPVSGFYWFAAGIWCNSGNNQTAVHLQLMRYQQSNSSTTAFAGANHVTQYNQLSLSGGTFLTSGDYVYLHQTGISVQGSTPRNYFSGYLVG